MPNSDNLPQLPKNQSAISTNGVVSRDWYRFFLNLLNKVNEGGGGGNGTGTVTSVAVSGGSTGLTTSGGPITTNGTITLSGTVNVANGGTGASTAANARTNLGVPSLTGSGASGTWGISVTGSASNVSGVVAIANGGTGATTAPDARTNLGAAASGANSDITSMTGVTGGISTPDFIQFDTAATVTDATGKLYYAPDDQYQTLAFQMNGSAIQRIGEELYYRVKLSAAATKGQVLMFSGTLGSSGGLQAAPATGLLPDQSNYILGVAHESGATNDWIFVTTFGEVKQIDTTGGAETWAQGDVLYYNPLVTGGLTKIKPTAPAAIATVAAVVHVGSSNGILFVRPTYGSVLGGTDGNVNFTSLTSGNTLVYDGNQSVWVNANLTASTGINVTNGNGSITLTNTGVTSLTGTASQVTVSGSTGNVTLSLPSPINVDTSGNAGTVTNGVYTTGSYADPTWITSLAGSKITGNISGSAGNVTGVVAIANGGTGQTTSVAAFDALSPTTTKGDLIVSNGTDNVRQAVGTDTYVLTADSTTATGVKWAASSGSGATITNDTTTATDLYPTFAAATSGSLTTIYTGNTKLLYKPSTGELTSPEVVASNGMFVNNQTISANYTIPAGSTAISGGPVTVASGIAVTVSSGARWVTV